MHLNSSLCFTGIRTKTYTYTIYIFTYTHHYRKKQKQGEVSASQEYLKTMFMITRQTTPHTTQPLTNHSGCTLGECLQYIITASNTNQTTFNTWSNTHTNRKQTHTYIKIHF